MDNVTLVIIVALVIVLALIVGFRHKVAVSLEALGVKLKAEGRARPETTGTSENDQAIDAVPGNSAVAKGERSVAIGGDAKGAKIVTGDNNKIDS